MKGLFFKLVFYGLCLLTIVTVSFILIRNIPGGPFEEEVALSPEVKRSLETYYGVDRPVIEQYAKYLKAFLTGDFGPSYRYKTRSVNMIIANSLPVSLALGGIALFIAIFGGAVVGVLGAYWRGRWIDTVFGAAGLITISIPSFVTAFLLQYWIAGKWKLLPIAGIETFNHWILPTISLAAVPLWMTARLLRNSLIEVLQKEYILAAYAKGLSERRIFFRHAIPNASFALLGFLAHKIPAFLLGSLVVEKMFAIPGLSLIMTNAILNRDYPVIMALVFVFSLILISIQWAIEAVRIWIDPRTEVNA